MSERDKDMSKLDNAFRDYLQFKDIKEEMELGKNKELHINLVGETYVSDEFHIKDQEFIRAFKSLINLTTANKLAKAEKIMKEIGE